MTGKAPKRPKDTNELAKRIVELATEPSVKSHPDDSDGKDPAAVSLGRRGGLKGGKARSETLSSDRKKEIALKAAQARWMKEKK